MGAPAKCRIVFQVCDPRDHLRSLLCHLSFSFVKGSGNYFPAYSRTLIQTFSIFQPLVRYNVIGSIAKPKHKRPNNRNYDFRLFLYRAVFKWLSKKQNQSNYYDQSQQEQTVRWTNHNHWLKNWRDSFKLITKRSNCNHVITFDSHLETALYIKNQWKTKVFLFFAFALRISPLLRLFRHSRDFRFSFIWFYIFIRHRSQRFTVSKCHNFLPFSPEILRPRFLTTAWVALKLHGSCMHILFNP